MNHSYFLITVIHFLVLTPFFFLIYDTSARRHQSHRSAGFEHQTGGAQTDTTKTARTRPGRDLEEGLPVSVVQDDRRGRLVPAAPQRRRLHQGETKRRRRDGEHGRCRRSFYDKRCLCDWCDRKCFDQHCELEAFAGSTDRRGNGPPLCPPPDCSTATAADCKSPAGTLNEKKAPAFNLEGWCWKWQTSHPEVPLSKTLPPSPQNPRWLMGALLSS